MPNLRCLYIHNIRPATDILSLPNELRYLYWDSYPFNSLSLGSNSENLVMLKLFFGTMEQISIEDHQDLVNLRILDVYSCGNLRNIHNLSEAINLQRLVCSMCSSLVEFPELPNSISVLELSLSGIKEVPDSIRHLSQLRELRLRGTMVENVSEHISELESLCDLELGDCNRLETLSELPRYLWYLAAYGCTSLEKVSFTDRSSEPFHSLHDGDDAPRAETVLMLFANCEDLNQESIKNIGENAMLQIQSLVQRWAMIKGLSREEYKRYSAGNKLFCCFPGKKVPAKMFCYKSMNSSLNLTITPRPNRCNKRRFLAFAICLVADLTRARNLDVICKYQLTAASGEMFTRECCVSETQNNLFDYEGDHVFIMFNRDMIIIDRRYEEASFEFYMKNNYGVEEVEVEKCAVHVFYVDAESYAISSISSNPGESFPEEDATSQ
ncbi:hypothetical protein V6N12_019452 [Hibiscus sabdariffa]|uniref:C-JID domain-containing protein n=1 Tax=Hibiscus sabdariffa TaxID=183260 RepID=A0ABR2BMA6_9ROSI